MRYRHAHVVFLRFEVNVARALIYGAVYYVNHEPDDRRAINRVYDIINDEAVAFDGTVFFDVHVHDGLPRAVLCAETFD